jgi:hypothetical protein
MQLERDLFGAWCGFVFQPGPFGRKAFEDTLSKVRNRAPRGCHAVF